MFGYDSLFKAIYDALDSNVNLSAIKTNTDKPSIVDSTDSNNIYTGFAAAGSATSSASWKIQKVSTVGAVVTTTYADGNLNYDNIWDNRASLSYS